MAKHEDDLIRSDLAGGVQWEDDECWQNNCLYAPPAYEPDHQYQVYVEVAHCEYNVHNYVDDGDTSRVRILVGTLKL